MRSIEYKDKMCKLLTTEPSQEAVAVYGCALENILPITWTGNIPAYTGSNCSAEMQGELLRSTGMYYLYYFNILPDGMRSYSPGLLEMYIDRYTEDQLSVELTNANAIDSSASYAHRQAARHWFGSHFLNGRPAYEGTLLHIAERAGIDSRRLSGVPGDEDPDALTEKELQHLNYLDNKYDPEILVNFVIASHNFRGYLMYFTGQILNNSLVSEQYESERELLLARKEPLSIDTLEAVVPLSPLDRRRAELALA